MRSTASALLALAALVLAGCGADAEADSRPGGTTTPTVPLTGLTALDQLTSAPAITAGPVPEPVRRRDVAIIGDSLTLSAEDEIHAALAATGVDVVAFDAVEGRRTSAELEDRPSGETAVAEIAAAHMPDVWVLALGTNDVGAQARPDVFRGAVEDVLGEVPAGASVIWLDLWIEGRIEGCRALNGVLREVAAGRGDMTVVDWFQFGDDPGLIVDDGVHLTDAGQLKFAEQIAQALGSAA